MYLRRINVLSKPTLCINNLGTRDFSGSSIKSYTNFYPKVFGAVGVGGLTTYALLDKENPLILKAVYTSKAFGRIFNLTSTVGIICFDYFYTMQQIKDKKSEFDQIQEDLEKLQLEEEIVATEYFRVKGIDAATEVLLNDQLLQFRSKISELSSTLANPNIKRSVYSEVHERSAHRLLNLCETNGGVYVKLGQHISQLDYILPEEYIRILRKLLANTPITDIAHVRKIIYEDFGDYPENIWHNFQSNPIASASLAQVHIAYDMNDHSRKYAVKIQHNNLIETAYSDMYAITKAVEFASYLFPEYSYTWLSREMNKNLPCELDFNHEASNIRKCTHLLSREIQSNDVVIPSVIRHSTRVLCMSFEEGFYVHDHDKMEASRLNKTEISKLVSEVFCQLM